MIVLTVMHDVDGAKLHRRVLDECGYGAPQIGVELQVVRSRLEVLKICYIVRVPRITAQFLDNARSKGLDDDDLFAGEVNAIERVLRVCDVPLNNDRRV